MLCMSMSESDWPPRIFWAGGKKLLDMGRKAATLLYLLLSFLSTSHCFSPLKFLSLRWVPGKAMLKKRPNTSVNPFLAPSNLWPLQVSMQHSAGGVCASCPTVAGLLRDRASWNKGKCIHYVEMLSRKPILFACGVAESLCVIPKYTHSLALPSFSRGKDHDNPHESAGEVPRVQGFRS